MRTLFICFCAVCFCARLLADPISPEPSVSPTISPSPSASPTVVGDKLQVTLGKDATGAAEELFTSTIPRVVLRWSIAHLPEKAKLRCVWIAEDVGDAAPKEYHVEESSLTPTEPAGTFSITRPTSGWPPGKYRAEVFLGEKLAATAAFTIENRGD